MHYRSRSAWPRRPAIVFCLSWFVSIRLPIRASSHTQLAGSARCTGPSQSNLPGTGAVVETGRVALEGVQAQRECVAIVCSLVCQSWTHLRRLLGSGASYAVIG